VTGGVIQAGATTLDVSVDVASDLEVETRVYFSGKGALYVDSVDILKLAAGVNRAESVSDFMISRSFFFSASSAFPREIPGCLSRYFS